MRVRVAATVLGITAALLAVPACSTSTTGAEPRTPTPTPSRTPADALPNAAPLSSAALEKRLLDRQDLGSGYLRKPEQPAEHEDVTVIGCPALSKLGGNAATGGQLTFPRNAKTTFAYGSGSDSEVSEALYSDSPNKLSDVIGRVSDAMTRCSAYQVVAGGTSIDVTSRKLPAPVRLGDEQWSQLLTFSAAGRSTVVQQTAIRDGSVLLIVSGSPALVDRHLDKALTKATAAA
ncbi:hypothetical protein [Streptomyces sp. NPDC046860]|uniref:hypothetical protein n=1 Tax=Streptomyces sp. NPDC046860 TaxID=3154495 RepID=UPI0033D7CF6F